MPHVDLQETTLRERAADLDRREAAVRRAEAELAAGHRRLLEAHDLLAQERNLFVAGPVVVFKWRNADGWPVEYVSPNVEEVLGYSGEELRSARVPYAGIIPRDDVARVGEEVRVATESGVLNFSHLPYRLVRKDGRTIWVADFTTILRDAEGAATHYLGYVVDVSELREAEDALRELEARMQQSQKLESLGLLAGGIAHDFNNVLTGVLGNAHLALINLEPDAEIVPFLSDIRKSAEHAADIVKQMMTYAGQSEAEFRSLDLEQLFRDIRHLLHAAIPKKIRLDVLPPRQDGAGLGLPPIAGDATQIRQVIMNLVLNGSEASEGGEGRVVVRAEAFDADSVAQVSPTYGDLPAGRYVVLEVADDGRGMDKETRERLFDPFFTTKENGRGLGMASVLGIVRQHRGAIQVTSEVGAGTEFRVYFPVATAGSHDVPDARAAPSGPWRGQGTILVVDDDPTIRRLVANLLTESGFSVLLAADGRDGLEVCKAHRDDVVAVLLDVTMPKLDGVETFHELRRLYPALPILMSSGYHARRAAVEGIVTGDAVGFIPKPFRPAALLEKIHGLLR